MPHKSLEQAVQFAIDHETSWSRDVGDSWGIHQQDPPPWNRLLGPVHPRGPVSGTIALNGQTLISWGEPDRADLTFDLAGQRVQSVSGGSHWGGGLSISSLDQARVGQLLLNDGRVNGHQVISSEWMRRMRTPCGIAPFYGYLIWLNHAQRTFPNVPASSCFAIGAGSSFTWIEPERRMVLVVRWINADHADAFFGCVLQAIDGLG